MTKSPIISLGSRCASESMREVIGVGSDLTALYESGQSIMDIARYLGVAYDTARRRLLKGGVRFRSNSEAVHLARGAQDGRLSDELLEMLDGLLLGDGSLEVVGVGARLRLPQRKDRSTWLDAVQDSLERHQFTCSRYPVPAKMVVIKGKQCRRNPAEVLSTRASALLRGQHARWYVDHTKIIPADLRLTGRSIAEWLAGDGSVGGDGYHILLSTQGFGPYVQVLARMLNERLGWHPCIGKRGELYITRVDDRRALHAMVSPYLPHCFAYKLDFRL